MSSQYQPESLAQGVAKPATHAEIDKETTYTDPNLHRRIEDTFYMKNRFDYPIEFVPNIYYSYDSTNDEYAVLSVEPDDWETDYNDYYHMLADINPGTDDFEGIAVGVFGVDSYRFIKSKYHNEENTESEIP